MKERDMQLKFNHFVRDNMEYLKDKLGPSVAFELKIEHGKSFAFKNVLPHQVQALCQSCNGSFYYKIPDDPIFKQSKTMFHIKRPYDCYYMSDSGAYIVVWFYEPRKDKPIYLIDINNFIGLSVKWPKLYNRKSMTEEQIKENSDHIFLLKKKYEVL